MPNKNSKLVNIFRVAKHHLRILDGKVDVRQEVRSAIYANINSSVAKVGNSCARLIADLHKVRARGVQLANVPSTHPAFQKLRLSVDPENRNFGQTYTFWLTGNLNCATITPSEEGLAKQGYYLPPGCHLYAAIRLADAVKLVDGAFAAKHQAVKTPWGYATYSSMNNMLAADLPKQLLKNMKGFEGQGVVPVPYCIFDPRESSTYMYLNGAYRRRLPPTDFQITSIGGYHSSNRQMHPLDHLNAGIRIGLEVELECPSGRRSGATGVSAAKFLNKHINPRYALVERDGSLTNGFELVISPASVEFHRKALQKLSVKHTLLGERSNPLKRCINPDGRDYNNAGIHIHADRRSVKNVLALRLFMCTDKRFWGIDWRKHLFGRSVNRFAGTCTEDYVREYPSSSCWKYEALNVEHDATVEARVFSSHPDPLVWLGHVEIFAALIEWTNEMVTASQERLTVEGFIAFVAKHSDKFPLAFERTDALQRRAPEGQRPPQIITTFDERVAAHA